MFSLKKLDHIKYYLYYKNSMDFLARNGSITLTWIELFKDRKTRHINNLKTK